MKKIVSFLLSIALIITSFNLNTHNVYAKHATQFAYRVDVVDSKADSKSRIAIDVAANENGKVYAYAIGAESVAPTVDELKKKGTITELEANKEITAMAYSYVNYSSVKIGNSYDVYICFENESGEIYGPYVEKGWVAKYYTAGDGTKANPYQIWNYRHLYNTAQISGTTYVKLMQDIDLTNCPYSGYVLGDGRFEGEFDGNHKSIINMYGKLIKELAKSSVVKNTYLVGVNSVTEGKNNVHYCDCTFVDRNYGTINGCAVINSDYDTHNDTYNVGVICVTNYPTGVITKCKAVNCSIICKDGSVGGIVGRNEGTISDCYFSGKLTNASTSGGAFGGIVGLNIKDTATVDKCYANVVFEGNNIRGGVAGQLSNGLISNCVSNYVPDDVWSVVRISSRNQGSIVGTTSSGASNSNVSNNQGAIISKPVSDGTPEVNKDLVNLENVWDIYHGELSATGTNTMVDPLPDAVIATQINNLTGMKNISFSLETYPSYETLEYNTYFPGKMATEAVEHTYTEYVSNGDGTHKVVCSDCDVIQIGHDKDACSGGTATCTDKAVCEKCGAAYGSLATHVDTNNDGLCDTCSNSMPHTHSGTKVGKQDATCTKYGVKEYYKCSCGTYYTDSACKNRIADLEAWKNGNGKIEKTSHSYTVEQTAEVPATCTAAGTTAVMKCATCTAKQGGETIEKLGHDYKITDNVTSTETVAGYIEYTCTRCTDSYKEPKPLANHVHAWIDDAEVPATCVTDGVSAGKRCSICSDKDGYAVIPATGHSYENGVCSICGYSEEATAVSVTKFATPQQLINEKYFSLWKEDGGVAGKVNFGIGKTWYIAGADTDGTLVLLCDPANPLNNNYVFNNEYMNNKSYKSFMGTYEGYIMPNDAKVYPNHYGASDLRTYLTGLYGEDKVDIFTGAEQGLMMETKVYTKDTLNLNNEKNAIYSTSDKLYLAYGDYEDKYITVGMNSASDLKNGIKVGLISDNGPKGSPYTIPNSFIWLRTPHDTSRSHAMGVDLGAEVVTSFVFGDFPVMPAFNMNLSSVLFASAATVTVSDATLEIEGEANAMTFRYDGTGKVLSTAVFDNNGVKVVKGGDNEYIYIQYKDESGDKVWSAAITGDMNISKDCVGTDSFANCKIWIEKKNKAENLTYAVMATGGLSNITGHDFGEYISNNDATCGENGTKTGTCVICGFEETVEDEESATGNHDFSVLVNATSHRCSFCSVISGHDAKNDGACSTCGYSEETSGLSVINFATPQQLINEKYFSLWKEDGGVAQKVNFGNGKTWYIAGGQNGELVLMSDPANPFDSGQVFYKNWDNQKYSPSMGLYLDYIMPDNAEVYANHYGASDVRKYLLSQYGAGVIDVFTSAEQSLMNDTRVYTQDTKHDNNVYSTTDKLYLAYGEEEKEYITVGANSASGLTDGIKIGLKDSNAPTGSPFANSLNGWFWLRTPSEVREYYAVGASCDNNMVFTNVDYAGYRVMPALHLNISSVIFASAAVAATSDTFLEIDGVANAMTFRMDGADVIKSSAIIYSNGIKVEKNASTNEYLYVQWKEGKEDKVYSVEITDDMQIFRHEIGASDLSNCKIWIETKKIADNLVYAKEVKTYLSEVLGPVDPDPQPVENPFGDVEENNWKFTFVRYVYDKGIMTGKGTDAEGNIIFAPDDYLTRAELAQMLYSMEGKPTIEYNATFGDVKSTDWFRYSVLWANENGIATGVAPELFNPTGKITREQVATMLKKYALLKGYDTEASADLSTFTDASAVSSWAVNNISWAVGKGVISGKAVGDGTLKLDPKGNATRAECAAMIKSFCEKVAGN